ncbi:M15 family metallopeptidase [soil metagenome]
MACATVVLAGGIAAPPAHAQPQGPVVEQVTAEQLGATWRPECPVAPDQLRRIELDYLGLDAQTHRGQIVVNVDLVDQTVAVFDRLYRMGFPIERMRTVDHYPNADDELSMRDNNTSAFNCRDIPGTGRWSYHAYGRAIDLNPRLNPYIDSAGVQPANAEVYVDRDRIDPGLLHAGDAAVRAFTDHGWRWGGSWRSPKDYQHFERD